MNVGLFTSQGNALPIVVDETSCGTLPASETSRRTTVHDPVFGTDVEPARPLSTLATKTVALFPFTTLVRSQGPSILALVQVATTFPELSSTIRHPLGLAAAGAPDGPAAG